MLSVDISEFSLDCSSRECASYICSKADILEVFLLIYEQTVCQVPRMIDNSVDKTLVSLVEENVASN